MNTKTYRLVWGVDRLDLGDHAKIILERYPYEECSGASFV
jgi:hypothetical protein